MKLLSAVRALVLQAGNLAVAHQSNISYHDREFKDDGSVVTRADTEVEDFLCNGIEGLYPGCNLVTEERSRSFHSGAEFTFVIDPIDGTDNFRNGMHNWSISVGLLDSALRPLGGIVLAPRLDLLCFADFDGGAFLGQSRLRPPDPINELTAFSGIMMSSRIHQQLSMESYPGKARAFGSAALHLCMPTAYPSVVGVIQGDRVFAWDIAGAHAVLLSVGCELCYLNGQDVDYSAMRSTGWRVSDFLVAGRPNAADLLHRCVGRRQ